MTKVVLVLLALTFGGLVAWLYWSPRHAAQEFRRAAIADDTAAVARMVNVPAVRKQFAADMQAALARACGGNTANNRFQQDLAQDVDRVASPGGLAVVAKRGWVTGPGASDSSRFSMGYDRYPSTYTLVVLNLNPSSSDTARLLFHRDGLTWRVERLQVPLSFDDPRKRAVLCQ